MRSILVVVGFLVIAALVLMAYRDIETRAMATQALAERDQTALELARLKAIVNSLGAQVENRLLPAHKTRVTVYTHDVGLTAGDAAKLAAALKPKGFDVRITRHGAPTSRPDAVFIGALIGAEEAQLVLSSLPYDVDYLLRVDYPRALGGDPEGRSLGVGFVAAQAARGEEPRTMPVKISRQQLAWLMQPKLANTEFQLRLRQLAGKPDPLAPAKAGARK
jgi:hypothetical protein